MTSKPRKSVAATASDSSVADGFANMVSGLGESNYKARANAYYVTQPSRAELEAAFRTSAWFRKIVVTRPRDGVRRWRSWQCDKADIELLENEEKRLGVRAKVLQALIWEQLFGGAAIIVGGLPGTNNEEPLEIDSVSKGSLRFLTVVTRYDINPTGQRRDPMDAWHGYPEHFIINGGAEPLKLHPSRVIAFRGEKCTPNGTGDEFWGDSIWMRLEQSISPVDASTAVVSALMQEAKVDIVRVPNLTKNVLTAEYEAAYVRRFHLSNLLKSVANTVLLDKDDEWSQKTITWTGIPEAVTLQLTIMAGAAGYPLTRLLGTQSKGLNNGGDADLKNYYDDVSAGQELDITPELNPLDEMLIRSATGKRDPGTWYTWSPLWLLTDKERAEVDKLQAEATQIYVNSALVPTEALAKSVQNRMVESGSWPGLDEALEEFGAELPVEPPEDDNLPGEGGASF